MGAASAAAGRGGPIGIDDIDVLDIYSCFPSAVELAAEALGIALDDSRRLTATGGLPYFGGPGNNYTTHGIAAVTDALRDPPETAGAHPSFRLGMATGLGWFITKHTLGVYSSDPPPGGFRRGDTTTSQAAIDGSAVETVLEVDSPTPATVIATTVIRDNGGAPTGAPLIAALPDGRHMAVAPENDEVIEAMGHLDVPGLVGTPIVVQAGAARYRLATS